MTEAELQRILELVNQDKDLFTANAKWTESVNIRGIKEAVIVPNSTDGAVSIAKQGVQNTDPLADVSKDRYKDSEPTYSKLTGKFIDKTRIDDVNGDGVVDDKDLQQEAQQEKKEQAAANIAEANFISDVRASVNYSQIDAHLYSSTSLTPSVEFANKSITQNTDKLVETLSQYKDKDNNKLSKEEIVEVTQATNVALKDAYTTILGTFDKAVEGKTDAEYKEVFRFVDDLDPKVYGLDNEEKEKIKDLWRGSTPEVRASILERALKGDDTIGMEGVHDAELQVMENAGDLLEDAKKFAKDNKLNSTTCFANGCVEVADFTMRSNFVHIANDLLMEQGQGITATIPEKNMTKAFHNGMAPKIVNPEVIENPEKLTEHKNKKPTVDKEMLAMMNPEMNLPRGIIYNAPAVTTPERSVSELGESLKFDADKHAKENSEVETSNTEQSAAPHRKPRHKRPIPTF